MGDECLLRYGVRTRENSLFVLACFKGGCQVVLKDLKEVRASVERFQRTRCPKNVFRAWI